MAKPILILTVGLPRAGKTTWAQKQGIPMVCPDAIRRALHGRRFVEESEPMVWLIARYMVKSLFLAGHRKVILDDAIHVIKKRREEWRNEAWKLQVKVFRTSREDCIHRCIGSVDGDVLSGVINFMADRWEEVGDEIDGPYEEDI